MEIPRKTRYPVRGRAQVALPDHRVLAARTFDIGEGGVCLQADEQIPVGTICPLCFELFVNGKDHVITASGKAVYCVFANPSGVRIGFQFVNSDQDRTRLIRSLGGKAPTARADVTPPAEPLRSAQ